MTNNPNDGYPPNPHLILLILGCCESNFSARNVDKFFESPDIAAMIKNTVFKHFPMGHTHYKGNEIEDPAAFWGQRQASYSSG